MATRSLSVYARFPPPELFSWAFDATQETVPPKPPGDSTWFQPFDIPTSLFNAVSNVRAPITISAVYLVTVIYLNRVNETRQNRPWSFAKTSIFKYLVLLHNIFLALFSAWSFCGICFVLSRCWPSLTQPNLLVNMADTLCQVTTQGDLRVPNFAIGEPNWYSAETQIMDGTQSSVLPSLGRLWDDGFGYFGCLLYISKFYEVVDTLILLAKGRRCSILQAYHHSGIMFCSWAALRYKSPPSLVGASLNSAIHTLMYSYYAWTALSFPVFGFIKKTLTTLQIAQFIAGCVLACSYFFIEYEVMIYPPGGHVGGLYSSTENNDLPYLSSTTVGTQQGYGIGSQLQNGRHDFQVQRIPCLKNSGQALALWLTTLYCLPLTYLCVLFPSLLSDTFQKLHQRAYWLGDDVFRPHNCRGCLHSWSFTA